MVSCFTLFGSKLSLGGAQEHYTPLEARVPLKGLRNVTFVEETEEGNVHWDGHVAPELRAVRVRTNGTGTDVRVTTEVSGPADVIRKFTATIDTEKDTLTAKLRIPNRLEAKDNVSFITTITYPAYTQEDLPPLGISTILSNVYLNDNEPWSFASVSVATKSGDITSTAPLTVRKNVDLSSSSGKIDVSGTWTVEGDARFTSTSGNISISAPLSVKGSARFNTTSGTIKSTALIRALDDLTFNTTSGGVYTKPALYAGRLTTRTTSGNIEHFHTDAATDAHLSSKSGKIAALYIAVGQGKGKSDGSINTTLLEAQTTSGNIVLAGVVAAGSGSTRVTANSTSGSIWAGLDDQTFGSVHLSTTSGSRTLGSGIVPGPAGRRETTGIINGGVHPAGLTAKSTSGSIQAMAETVSKEHFTMPPGIKFGIPTFGLF
ncbi:uncharacterized protein EV422DRAFT_528795 [Fimicolochytrium jonesii]|uniref:uncharacterized protein n=1 Tax=Fimicolochytrium jonesii TaxID=1396493 RepID=UPI0022FEF7A7|nr:uncharacterized protein EV422DRAFT_528795 [Fimicolochytrium jonesii]KAI8821027.1 hypothetical protein EV422DRAFT_528795 [Fimicolochytrium jonesii]